MSFFVSAPGVREERYVMCGREKSGDKAADWEKDDNVTFMKWQKIDVDAGKTTKVGVGAGGRITIIEINN